MSVPVELAVKDIKQTAGDVLSAHDSFNPFNTFAIALGVALYIKRGRGHQHALC